MLSRTHSGYVIERNDITWRRRRYKRRNMRPHPGSDPRRTHAYLSFLPTPCHLQSHTSITLRFSNHPRKECYRPYQPRTAPQTPSTSLVFHTYLSMGNLDRIRSILEECLNLKWGFVIFRCTAYGNDKAWAKFMWHLNERVRRDLKEEGAEDHFERIDWCVQDHPRPCYADEGNVRR